ncbi:MAG: glycosyltransferase [Crocinitomicaceae bacterium]
MMKENEKLDRLNSLLKSYNRIVLWGFTENRHSHYFIHQSYYKFLSKHTDSKIIWIENNTENNELLESGDLVMVPDVHLNTPYEQLKLEKPRTDITYIFHPAKALPEDWFENENLKYIRLFEYRNAYLRQFSAINDYFERWRPFVYFFPDAKTLLQPWGCHFTPSEFLEPSAPVSNEIYFIGTLWGDEEGKVNGNRKKIKDFEHKCQQSQMDFKVLSGISDEEEIKTIRTSLFAPNIGALYHDVDSYLQCRTFKSIAYGALVITDTPGFKEILKEGFVEFQNWSEAIEKIKGMTEEERLAIIQKQQDFIKNYTYLDHWLNILEGLERL